jgi:putative endonuclease
MLMHFVYIIETEDGTYYTGVTNNLARRLQEHVSGGPRSAAYLRSHKPKYVVYINEHDTRSAALKHEYRLKRDQRLKLESVGPRRDILEVIDTELGYQ